MRVVRALNLEKILLTESVGSDGGQSTVACDLSNIRAEPLPQSPLFIHCVSPLYLFKPHSIFLAFHRSVIPISRESDLLTRLSDRIPETSPSESRDCLLGRLQKQVS